MFFFENIKLFATIFFMKTFTYTLTNQTINSLIDFSIFKQEKKYFNTDILWR